MATYIAIFVLFVVPVAADRRLLDGARPAGKDRPQAAPPAVRGDPTLCLLSLVFGGLLWPIAWLWAYTKPVGLQARLRHRQASRLLQGARAPEPEQRRPPTSVSASPPSRHGACRRLSSMPFAPTSPRSKRGSLAASERGELMEIILLGIYSLLRLADLHQVQAAAVDDALEGCRRDLPGGRAWRR